MVALTALVVSSCVSYLISIRGEKYEKLANTAIMYRKNLSSLDYLSYTNVSRRDGPLYSHVTVVNDHDLDYMHQNRTVLFAVLSFIFLSTIMVMGVIRACLCSTNFASYPINRGKDSGKQGMPVPVAVYVSAMTRTPVDL